MKHYETYSMLSKGSMCTFTYPYMNGRLHIGHAMTIVNTDVATRLRKQQGQEVLFPFGFHCTGMPIYASAKKLQHGDQETRNTLLSMGVSESELDLFKNPLHWVHTFPQLAMSDLQRLNLCCDFTRSFVTTNVNPYYNSFVQWQYRQLQYQRCLKLMERPCIYSVQDGQPCADHDRSTGEGIKPVEYQLWHRDHKFYARLNTDTRIHLEGQGNMVNVVILSPQTKTSYQGVVPEHWKQCLIHQGYNVTDTSDARSSASSDMFTGVTMWLPAGDAKITSRTGDRCIVARVPQWYITYSDPEWRQQAINAVNKMTIHDAELRKQLLISINNMDDWCVSREYGLGTRLPCDPQFLVDSLSDSTIYMAYYTVCHLLHRDLYGHDQIVPSDQVDDLFWDEVLLGKAAPYRPCKVSASVINEARTEFLKWYPPSLRVSGKDLIYNHLTMSIFQHVKLFGPEFYCQEYQVNGYAKINGKKMSKSTGNFITLHDALEKYPRVDALRVLLVESGDGLEDANIQLKNYQNVCDALDTTRHALSGTVLTTETQEKSGLSYHKLYRDMISYCTVKTYEAFKSGKYREALTYGWRKCEKVLSAYLKYPAQNHDIIVSARKLQAATLSPIIGEELEGLELEIKGLDRDSLEKQALYYELVQAIIGLINKTKLKSGNFKLKIHERLIEHERDILEHVFAFTGRSLDIIYDQTVLHPKRDPYRLKPQLTS